MHRKCQWPIKFIRIDVEKMANKLEKPFFFFFALHKYMFMYVHVHAGFSPKSSRAIFCHSTCTSHVCPKGILPLYMYFTCMPKGILPLYMYFTCMPKGILPLYMYFTCMPKGILPLSLLRGSCQRQWSVSTSGQGGRLPPASSEERGTYSTCTLCYCPLMCRK